jgi:hypothetical protein
MSSFKSIRNQVSYDPNCTCADACCKPNSVDNVMGVNLSNKYHTMNNCLGCNMDKFVTGYREPSSGGEYDAGEYGM